MLRDTTGATWRAALLGGIVGALLMAAIPVVAAAGGNLILGQDNGADAVTGLTGSAASNLRLTNNQAGAPALDLRVVAGSAPLKVNSSAVVAKLNADRLDGRHAAAFALAGHLHNGLYLAATGQAADSALFAGRAVNQIRPSYLGCSSNDISGGLWLCNTVVSVPGPGTLVFSGSAEAQYTNSVGSSVLNCYFLVDGYVEPETYRHGVLSPTEQYGFCASEGTRAGLAAGDYTVGFYMASSDQDYTPLGAGSVEVLFFPSS